jgi:hypothetical protein
MNNKVPVPWTSSSKQIVPQSAKTAVEIANRAVQLRKRDIAQIVSALSSEHYEMASTFVWSRAITALKKQLSSLGSEFIGEMLQRPDIDTGADIIGVVTPSEAIALAEDLGMISSTDAMRLRHAHETINHFAEYEDQSEEEPDEGMTREEAFVCLRACVNSILGQPKLEVAQDFATFRKELEERTFLKDDAEFLGLLNSPYFFLKTTLSVLLALLRTSTGAQLEHVVRNTRLILPRIWDRLRKPERWQAGQTYAEIYAEGKKDALNGLKATLSEVAGFDYVPENLRSATFTRAGRDVLEAHQGVNNFYNEPGPMRALAALGTTIPSPAFPVCMTATLSVWLGNAYGHCWAAQDSAKKVLRGLSKDRWTYYLDEVLPRDSDILVKLTYSKPAERWAELVKTFDVQPGFVELVQVQRLIRVGAERNLEKIRSTAEKIIALRRDK